VISSASRDGVPEALRALIKVIDKARGEPAPADPQQPVWQS